MRKSYKIAFTYNPWWIQRMIAPILWLSSTIFVYKLLVAPAGYSWIFENYAGTKDYVGFAILGSAMTGYWNNVLWGMGYALDRE